MVEKRNVRFRADEAKFKFENIYKERMPIAFISCLMFIVFLAIIKTAWISDDAMISFRSAINFVHGYGLRWNIIERVQSFTNPLWTLFLSLTYFIYRDIMFNAIFFSIAFTMAALYIAIFKIGNIKKETAWLTLVVTTCIFSKSFIDFSTSGLEAPLTFILLAMIGLFQKKYYYLRDDLDKKKLLFWIIFLSSLTVVNRLDMILLVAPIVYFAMKQTKEFKLKNTLKSEIIALSPIALWLIFAVVYYGFPFPNTYYAKLHTGITTTQYIKEGLFYYFDVCKNDVITMAVIFVGFIIALREKKNKAARAMSLGITLYMIYIFKIGGDFMSGRFFAVPFFTSILILCSSKKMNENVNYFTSFLILCICLFMIGTPAIRDDVKTMKIKPTNIINERAAWYRSNTYFAKNFHTIPTEKIWDQKRPKSMVIYRYIGAFGLHTGPNVHIIDRYALSEPFLARLPLNKNYGWRIGHYLRGLPIGYLKTLAEGQNHIQDRYLANYYKVIHLITRGDIFSKQRLTAIWRINTGKYDYLIDNMEEELEYDIKDRKPIIVY